MDRGKPICSQLMTDPPMPSVRRSIGRYRGAHWIKSFNRLDHDLGMAFAPLTSRESLRDIEAGACLPSWTVAVSTSPASIA